MASTVLRFVGLWVWLRGSRASVGHVLPHIDALGAAALFASAALLVSTAAFVTSASGFTRLASPSGEDRVAPVNQQFGNARPPSTSWLIFAVLVHAQRGATRRPALPPVLAGHPA